MPHLLNPSFSIQNTPTATDVDTQGNRVVVRLLRAVKYITVDRKIDIYVKDLFVNKYQCGGHVIYLFAVIMH
jgi:hypothetical protein